ncbi:hypothetical protein E2C01_005039 [Portunus trituberculatus]|uniref:Uncharacterized protein n=1 Tax=Portunus trituberculatus TaxID=210409 RepID=A0A5B7CRK5_PORTR|nr:hypothetical protein [Portunus trituberculatus]
MKRLQETCADLSSTVIGVLTLLLMTVDFMMWSTPPTSNGPGALHKIATSRVGKEGIGRHLTLLQHRLGPREVWHSSPQGEDSYNSLWNTTIVKKFPRDSEVQEHDFFRMTQQTPTLDLNTVCLLCRDDNPDKIIGDTGHSHKSVKDLTT